MRTYPKFLKRTPTFFGLNFIDIGLVMASLLLAMILNLTPFMALVIATVLILIAKALRKYLDFTALFVSKKENRYDSF